MPSIEEERNTILPLLRSLLLRQREIGQEHINNNNEVDDQSTTEFRRNIPSSSSNDTTITNAVIEISDAIGIVSSSIHNLIDPLFRHHQEEEQGISPSYLEIPVISDAANNVLNMTSREFSSSSASLPRSSNPSSSTSYTADPSTINRSRNINLNSSNNSMRLRESNVSLTGTNNNNNDNGTSSNSRRHGVLMVPSSETLSIDADEQHRARHQNNTRSVTRRNYRRFRNTYYPYQSLMMMGMEGNEQQGQQYGQEDGRRTIANSSLSIRHPFDYFENYGAGNDFNDETYYYDSDEEDEEDDEDDEFAQYPPAIFTHPRVDDSTVANTPSATQLPHIPPAAPGSIYPSTLMRPTDIVTSNNSINNNHNIRNSDQDSELQSTSLSVPSTIATSSAFISAAYQRQQQSRNLGAQGNHHQRRSQQQPQEEERMIQGSLDRDSLPLEFTQSLSPQDERTIQALYSYITTNAGRNMQEVVSGFVTIVQQVLDTSLHEYLDGDGDLKPEFRNRLNEILASSSSSSSDHNDHSDDFGMNGNNHMDLIDTIQVFCAEMQEREANGAGVKEFLRNQQCKEDIMICR